MIEPIHPCARCGTPVKSLQMEGPDFTYFWFHCKKCTLKWAALRPPPPKPEGTPGGQPSR